MKLHWILLSAWAPGLWAADSIKPEVHAFTSFGWLDTTDNNWLGQSQGGTTEFWEAAANASIQPLPTMTLSGQLFVRDFQGYDNGRAQLDWLYGEWRPRDSLGLQLGRVKYPFGLYNEIRDVDAARATVFYQYRFTPYALVISIMRPTEEKYSGLYVLGLQALSNTRFLVATRIFPNRVGSPHF